MLDKAALILVDIQNDFCPGGTLAVPKGDEVVAVANKMVEKFKLHSTVLTQDWHPANHGSFAANAGVAAFSVFSLNGLPQVAWPIHCLQGTHGAEFHRDLNFDVCGSVQTIVKGTNRDIDSYSGFFDNRASGTELKDMVNKGHVGDTGLYGYLRDRAIANLFVMGLATDYCVKATVLDGLALGFNTTLVIDGCRGVNINSSDSDNAVAAMVAAGAKILTSDKVE